MRTAMLAFKEALDRVRSGETTVEEVVLPSGNRVRLIHDPDSEACYRVEPLRGLQTAPSPGTEGCALGGSEGGTEDEDDEDIEAVTAELADTGDDAVFDVEAEDISVRSLVFDEPQGRPKGYPADLPFLPDRSVSFMEIGPHGVRLLSWSKIPDPVRILSTLKEELLAGGWTLVRDTTEPTGVLRTVGMVFQRDGLERFFLLTSVGENFHLMMREFRTEQGEDVAPPAADEAG